MNIKKPSIIDYTLALHNHNGIASGGTISWSAISGTTTSANIASMITDETGSGQLVFSTGATMLNTIISGLTVNTINGSVLGSNAFSSTTYQPLNSSLNSVTALTYASASFVKMTASNTFSLDTNTYLTSLAWTGLTGSITSAQLATALTNETGSGQVVFSTGATMLNTIISGLTANNLSVANTRITNVANGTGSTDAVNYSQLQTFINSGITVNVNVGPNIIYSGPLVSGYQVTNAENSIFLGYQSAYQATNASNSNFLGWRTGFLATNASNSNFIGYDSGDNATNASNSNFIGNSAGLYASNASNSIFIGQNAGIYDTVNNVSNTGYSILIGPYTSTSGYSNSIAIGSGATNTTTNQFLISSQITQLNIRSLNYTFPTSHGSSGYVLTNNGSGTLSWNSGATGSALPSPIYLTQGFTGQTSVAVTHNLGVYPLVQLLDTTNTMFIPLNIVYNSLNQFTVTFSISTTGTIIYSVGGVSVISGGTTINQTISGTTSQIVFYSGTTVSGDTSMTWDNTNKTLKLGNGTPTTTVDPNHTLMTTKTSTTFLSVDVQNLSNSVSGSTDFIANADTATDSTNYIDLGINSSTYTDVNYNINGALGGYLYNIGGDLSIGTATATKNIKFHTGGNLSSNLRGTISDIGFTSTGIFTGVSVVYNPQVNTPTGTAYTWQLFGGHRLTLTLTSSTGDVTVTTSTQTAGAHSELFVIGHATLSRNVSLIQSGVTWVYNGVSNITTVSLGAVSATKTVCWNMSWQTALICHITRVSSDDGIPNFTTEFTNEYSATSGQTGFTLSHVPSLNSVVKMHINGVRISNTAISTVSTAATYNPTNNGSTALVAGDRIQIDYYY